LIQSIKSIYMHVSKDIKPSIKPCIYSIYSMDLIVTYGLYTAADDQFDVPTVLAPTGHILIVALMVWHWSRWIGRQSILGLPAALVRLLTVSTTFNPPTPIRQRQLVQQHGPQSPCKTYYYHYNSRHYGRAQQVLDYN
jgi:hypothetical protein